MSKEKVHEDFYTKIRNCRSREEHEAVVDDYRWRTSWGPLVNLLRSHAKAEDAKKRTEQESG